MNKRLSKAVHESSGLRKPSDRISFRSFKVDSSYDWPGSKRFGALPYVWGLPFLHFRQQFALLSRLPCGRQAFWSITYFEFSAMYKFAFAALLFVAFTLALSTTTLVLANNDINSVDFKNFTYPAYCAGDQTENITVKNGEYAKETQMDGYVDRIYFNVFHISYGDLTGDGKDEAVILSICNTGGTGNFSEGYIYTEKSGKPVLLAHIPGGDRAYGGLRKAEVENGILVLESNDPGENGANCCPEFAVTNRYRLNGAKLTAVGKPVRRELFPTERINFAKGTTGSAFEATIPVAEGKRFVVAARAGQTLKVSADSDKVSLRLLNDAIVTEGINSFTARLPRNGDYTFEIQNGSDHEISVTVNVKIQ
jgi:hypothetical protein